MASISTEYQDRLRVLFLASEWGSSKGGLSTINRELAINIAKSPGVDVTLFVLRCSDDDKNAALRHKINLVKATRHPGMDELQWLSFLPDDLHSDVVVGHGSKFGPQAYTIRKSQKCKWVQVVHTVPEELGMHKTYANPIAGAERKHKREVELCESADFVVPIGPKLYEAFRCYLSSCKKGEMIFNFTPGIFSEFLEVEQVAEREGKFQVLLFGRGDKEDFFVKGFDIAAKAVASLENIKLVFVGAKEGELEDVKDSFLECGIEASNLTVRSFLQDRESLKSLFCEVDLAVMPSRTEGFGLAALEALSAGLPILVSKNSGFGEALSKVQFGPYFVVNSDDPQVWANAIKRLQDRDRCDRLEESELLRSLYAKRYSWEKQCKEFILKMASAVEGLFKQSQSVTFQGASQQTGISSGCHSGILTMSIEMESATFQENHSGDDTLLMKEMAMQFFDTMAAGIPNEDKPKCLYYYLEGARQVKVKQAVEGSLRITVECPTLEILEQLWEDYCSGHLNAVAEECLLTEDIKRRFHVVSVSLKTRILEEDYLACKEFLKDYSESHQQPQVKERVNLLQDHTQAAGVTHGESVVDFEPVMLHFSVNGKGQLPNMQRGSAHDTDGNQVIFPEELLNKEVSGSPFEEFPAYLQKIKLTHNSWPSEESVNKLLVAVECKNTEILDQLWRDYRSGHLNVVAEKFLLTDDIKRRFHLKSVKFKTTILEEDYLACKAFLLNNSTHGEERNSHNNLDLHDVRGGLESTEPTSVSAKTSDVKGKVMDRNREEEDESKKLNQQPRTENTSKKKKKYKPPKESEESAQTISSSDHKMKEAASSSKGEAHAAVNYLEEPDNIMSVKGSFTETSPLVGALPLNTKMLRSSSQANVDSDTDTANLAQQNFPKPRNKACQSNEGTQNTDGMTKDKRENTKKVIRCIPRSRGFPGRCISYEKGSVLDAKEDGELEFISLVSAPSCSLPWKIMEKAKKFICACLNVDRQGIIYFGVGDSQEKGSKYHHGEIIGLDVEQMRDEINKAFQFVLDDHIKSDAGPLRKGGEQNCADMYFVPVKSQGTPSHSFIIEIEVARDWRLCKDKVYYSKSWIEKREVYKESGEKRALSDFFEVKDEFDDVAVRTNGASTSVKPFEVESQVKKPLEVKYKDWRKKTKQVCTGTEVSLEDPIPNDSDVEKFSALVKKRLRDLNFKDFGYVLIANKLPPRYRGTPKLAFLQNIPWLAVFDLFDATSKKDGLYYACNETTDAPRAKLRSLDDFKEAPSDWISGKPDKGFDLSTRGTTWILGNEEMQKGDWIKCSRDCFYRALSTYKFCCPLGRLMCLFLGLDERNIQEMVDMMECCFSILGDSASNCVTVISESKHVTDAFIKASRLQRELRDCSITDIPWSLLREIVREMVGPTKFEEREAKTELPFFTGLLKEVFNKMIHSWDDLEVYVPNPRLPRLAEDIEKARNAFYKGAQASQTNLFHNHCIERTLEEETMQKIEQALKTLSKPSKETTSHVITVTVTYEPGSGATTLCRRILWKKRTEYRCAVVKAITTNTDYQIEQLQGITYDEKNFKFAPPCLVLVDNFPENETRRLTETITRRQTKCVILSTFPIGKLSANSHFDLTLRQLDIKEMSLVKDILINITSDSRRRKGAEEVLEREKRFIWFGLELFGREYDKIEERLQNHIKSTLDFLDDSQEIHETVLNFCCFLHYYSDGRAILPHPVVTDLLYEACDENEEKFALMPHIHKIFGGLLLEGFDETNGYYGWRPAHSLVSEAVTSRINVEETAIALMEQIQKGKAYVNKFLKEQVFKVFLDRKRISDPVYLEHSETHDESIDSDFEDDVLGFYEVKTRYSPLILDILEGNDGIQRALRLLIKICLMASEVEEKAYAWQQLARFMGYEMRANEMEAKNEEHCRLHTTMIEERGIKLPMPKIGIEAAHISVDIAINEQPKYSHHYVTKGTLYLLQLRDFKSEDGPTLSASMTEVIDVCRKALEVYDKALSTTHELNYYSMIGKVQAIVSLLQIVKGLPFFRLDGESMTKYLKTADIPSELEEVLTQEEHNYIKDLSATTLGLLNEIFGDVKFRQMTTYGDNAVRGLINAKLRASKLRRAFYEVTGFDRNPLRDMVVPTSSQPFTRDAQALCQQFVQDVLFINNETTYSTWVNLSDGEVSKIYNSLKVLCSRGYGSRDDMLICCKACLRLQEKPSVKELDEIVTMWVSKFPDSEWAHLFNYMIHFPVPDKRLAFFNYSAKESITKCDKIVLNKTGKGFRRSGAEYFLGKGTGLYAIANSQQFRSLEKGESKTNFWRSREISEKLERVCGQKDVNFNGVITYQGIKLRFDDKRYPKQSKDDLWFYVGFTLSGPYAYDPVDNDTYAAISSRKDNETFDWEFPLIDYANGRDNLTAAVPRREKQYEPRNTKRGQRALAANAGDFPDICIRPLYVSSQVPNLLNTLISGSPDVPREPEKSAVSSSCFDTHARSAMSSWVSIENVYQPGTSSNRVSYASAVQQGRSRQEEQVPKSPSRPKSGQGRKWKSIEVTRGTESFKFTPKYVDEAGKLHHGAWVLGAKKSKECETHTSEVADINITNRCPFAHSWRGDTLQHVCLKCTRANRPNCKERRLHEPFIYNLGPYCTEEGKIWNKTRAEQPK